MVLRDQVPLVEGDAVFDEFDHVRVCGTVPHPVPLVEGHPGVHVGDARWPDGANGFPLVGGNPRVVSAGEAVEEAVQIGAHGRSTLIGGVRRRRDGRPGPRGVDLNLELSTVVAEEVLEGHPGAVDVLQLSSLSGLNLHRIVKCGCRV